MTRHQGPTKGLGSVSGGRRREQVMAGEQSEQPKKWGKTGEYED